MFLVPLALASVRPLAESPVLLGPGDSSWSTRAVFDGGPAELSLMLRHPVLDERSALTVLVDELPVERVSLAGTPVPHVVPLGALEGPHTVTLRARVLEPGRVASCDPGEGWLRVESESWVEGVATDRSPRPSEVAGWIRGRDGHLQGGSDLLFVEAAGLVLSWGGALDGDAFTVELRDTEGDREVDWNDGVLEIRGDAAFVRSLRDPEVLRRCTAWPCRFSAGSLPVPLQLGARNLVENGFPQGIRLVGRDERVMVMAAHGPHREATIRLRVRVPDLPMDAASSLSLSLEGRPLAQWSLGRLGSGEAVLEAPLPTWALDAEYWRFTLTSDLEGREDTCERGMQPWLTVEADSGVAVVRSAGDGIAAAARRVRGVPTARLCLETHADPVLARLLHSLRRQGGWQESCEDADVLVTSTPPDGFAAAAGGWWSRGGDPVPAAADRWTLEAGDVLRVHVPAFRSPTRAVGWTLLSTDRAVSVRDGWSGLDRVSAALPLPEGEPIRGDATAHRASLDLVFGGLFVLLFCVGVGWIWRSRGSRDGWMEPSH